MNISGERLTESVHRTQQTRAEIEVAVLKKAQDQVKQQGEAMVRILEQVPTGQPVSLLDTFA